MQHVIIAIHLMVVIALVALVLYQKSEGSALGLSQSGLFSGRGQANALTRATAILGTIFFLTSIALTVLPAWERRAAGGDDWTTAVDQDKLEVKEIKPAPGAAPDAAKEKEKAAEEEKGSIFDQLKRAQQKRQGASQAPTAPSVVVPSAPPAPASVAPETPANEKPALRPTTDGIWSAPKTEAAPQAPAEQSAKPADEPAKPAASSAPSEAPAPKPVPAAPNVWVAPTK